MKDLGLLNSYETVRTRSDPVELFLRCAANRQDEVSWSAFLRQYAPRIRYFVRGTLRRNLGRESDPYKKLPGALQENDLLQNVILRLVKNDCAAMRHFSGRTEEDLSAYLAVISRSVVIDVLRRLNLHQDGVHVHEARGQEDPDMDRDPADIADVFDLERGFLAKELASLAQKSLKRLSGPFLPRDRLVCDLYFTHDLSMDQIARCKGINLSRGGVEKLLRRLINRVRASASAQVRANRNE